MVTKGRTRWRPETCGCVINYAWSINEFQDEPNISDPRFEAVCEAHKNTPPAERFEAVRRHNRTLRRAF